MHPSKNNNKAILFAITAVLLWSTVATAFKKSLQFLSPAQTLFFAIATTLIILILILIFQKKQVKILPGNRKEWLFSALLGLLNPFLYYIILFKAYSMLPAQLAQPLNYTWPVMLVILSVPILGHKISLKNLIAILTSFLGVILISLKDNFSINIENPLGIILATGSSLFWASFWLFNVKDTRDEIVKLLLNFIFGLIYTTIYILLFETFTIPPIEGILGSTYIGFFEMGITFVLWLKAMQYSTSTDKIANYVYLSPFLSLFFIHFLLGETIYTTTIAGLVLIVGGILIQQGRKKSNS